MPEAVKQYITCEKGVMRGYHMTRCNKRAKVERGGHWYCGTHDPVAVAAKDKAKREKWDEESRIRDEKFKRENAIRDLCVGVDTEQLKRLGKGWVKLVLDSIATAGYFGY